MLGLILVKVCVLDLTAELLENLDCVLHGVPVGAGTHDDADERLSHWVLFVINLEF